MYNIYVAGNCLVKFVLTADSHLPKLTPSEKKVKEKNIFKEANKNIIFNCIF